MASVLDEFRPKEYNGYVDKINADSLAAGVSQNCRNVISKVIGKLSTRNGCDALNDTAIAAYGVQGLTTFYNNAGLKFIVAACNGSVYYWDGTNWLSIKSGLDATAMIQFERCIIGGKDVIVGMNGVDTPFYWDGTAATDPATDVTTTLAMYDSVLNEELTADAAYEVYSFPTGRVPLKSGSIYIYSNSVLLDSGDYTLDLGGGVGATAAQITFDVARTNAVTDGETTAYLVYTKFIADHPFTPGVVPVVHASDKMTVLTPASIDYEEGSVSFATDQSANCPIYIDYTWADIIKADYYWSTGNVPAGSRYPIMHKQMLFCFNSDVDLLSTLRWSNPNKYEAWTPTDIFEINAGDGDEGTAIISSMSELFLFKKRSIHSLRGTERGNPQWEALDKKTGCAGPMALAADKSTIYLANERGIYVFNGSEAENISDARIPILWSTVNQAVLDKAIVKSWQNYIWVWVATGISTTNNLLLVIDKLTGNVWPMTGDIANISCVAEYSSPTGLKLYGGSATTGKVLQLDVGADDDGVYINAYWESADIDAGASDKAKRARGLFVEDTPDTATPFSVSVDIDKSGAFTAYTAAVTSGVLRKFDVNDSFRHITIRLDHSVAGLAEVAGLALPYKMKEKSGL